MTLVSRLIEWLSAPYTLFLVLQDKTASRQTKVRAGIILGIMAFYILNPLDLIPDIHPLLGWLDDLVILPIGMAVAQRSVPEIDLKAMRVGARAKVKRVVMWTAAGAIGLSLVGMAIFALLVWQLIR